MDHQDALTGILNRQGIVACLDTFFVQAVQGQEELSLIMFDIDFFKAFNDTHGHRAGDALIQRAANTLRDVFVDGCSVGRYGGEEFLVVVPGLASDRVLELAEEARKRFADCSEPLAVDTDTLVYSATLSGGMASYPTDAREIADLTRKTEQALYLAKQTGRDRICPYEDKDGLTGLFNHHAIVQKLDEAVERATQKGGSVSIISFDLNHFKQFNDKHGHRFGDELLKRIANIFYENFMEGNFVGRYGGDEFLVVLPGARTDTAFILAEEVRRLIADQPMDVSLGDSTVDSHMTVSAGVATYPTDARERVDLIRKANEALYRAKQMGRNSTCLSTSSQMITKTSHFTQTQLERLAQLAKSLGKSEAFLLREALDELMRKYDESFRAPNGTE